MIKSPHVALLMAALLLPGDGRALSSDRDQPMTIEADRVELDDAKGISTYHGNVKVTQGTLELTGERMTVYTKGNQVQKVIMLGDPATYRQRPDGKDEDVRAKSRRMEYYTNPEHVILLKAAEVWQSGDVLRSERIEYDIARDHVNAGTSQPDERVRITIQPRGRKGSKEASPP
jgi:lipopolysaccharide export system protein LptA